MPWAPDYSTPQLVTDYLDVDTGSVDAYVGMWITTVSRNVDDFCHRQFGKTDAPEERYYTPVWDRRDQCWYVDVDDLDGAAAADLVIEDDSGQTVTGAVLLPRNAAVKGRPYERLRLNVATGEIAGTAVWGWSAVPAAVPTALLLFAARLNARMDSPFGIAGSPSEGSEIRLLAQLDPDFRTVLKPWRRMWWAQ